MHGKRNCMQIEFHIHLLMNDAVLCESDQMTRIVNILHVNLHLRGFKEVNLSVHIDKDCS